MSAPTNAPGRWVTGLSHGQIPPPDSCLIHCLVGYFVSVYRIYKYAIAKICQNHESNWIDHTNIRQRRVELTIYTENICQKKMGQLGVKQIPGGQSPQPWCNRSWSKAVPVPTHHSHAPHLRRWKTGVWLGSVRRAAYGWPWWFMFMVETQTSTEQSNLVGGWPTPLKNMKVSWDDDIPNIFKNKKCSKPPIRNILQVEQRITIQFWSRSASWSETSCGAILWDYLTPASVQTASANMYSR